MADDQDDSQKTEEPSQKRLDDAREKGQIASSREINNFVIIGTATLLCATALPSVAMRMTGSLTAFLAHPAQMAIDGAGLGQALLKAAIDVGLIMALPMGAFMVAAIVSAAVQNGIVFTTEPMVPKFEKISPMSGIKRLFSLKSLVEFVKNLTKMALIATLAMAVLWPQRSGLVMAGQLEPPMIMRYLHEASVWLLGAITAALAMLALFDYAYQHFEFMKKMRMSRQDLKDEHKQSDGDPHIKQKLRQLRMEKAQQRMMSEVPKSTVVVTNPTHVSVALRYEPGEGGAPRVVAKGVDELALRIREIAKVHGIPIVESPPLARALNKQVDIGQMIPQAHFQAVAEIIGYVFRLRDGQNAPRGT